jgi:hypothetical protein
MPLQNGLLGSYCAVTNKARVCEKQAQEKQSIQANKNQSSSINQSPSTNKRELQRGFLRFG